MFILSSNPCLVGTFTNVWQVEDSRRIVRLEDWQSEQVLPIAHDVLTVRFTSDATDTESGFDITYKAVGRCDSIVRENCITL